MNTPLSYTLTTDAVHGPDRVFVTRSDGRSWSIHREDANPEHRFVHYRLAAGWFGNLSAAVKSEPLTNDEWREFQSIPEQGYSHRAWMDNKIQARLATAEPTTEPTP